MDQTPLDKAIEAVGTQQALADRLGIKSPSITDWRVRGRVPAERCLAIEAATGVSRHDLRPDIFGPVPAEDHDPDAGRIVPPVETA